MNKRIVYYNNNKERALFLSKKYYDLNKDKILEKKRNHYLLNKKDKIKKVTQYQKEKYKTDINFKIKVLLRSRIIKAIKKKNKSSNTMNLLGVKNIEFLWNYLEKKFKKGMTRYNHGLWHIDHIKPCASFDLTKKEEQEKCFHYTNLQPLWSFENLSKNKY